MRFRVEECWHGNNAYSALVSQIVTNRTFARLGREVVVPAFHIYHTEGEPGHRTSKRIRDYIEIHYKIKRSTIRLEWR